MRRLAQVLWILGLTFGAPGRADAQLRNPFKVRHLGGCKVEITMSTGALLPPFESLRRARAWFAFSEDACSQPVKVPVPSNATLQVFAATDEVCADGTWFYRLGNANPPDPFGEPGLRSVEVHGCVSKTPCPAPIERPAAVAALGPAPAPCKLGPGFQVRLGEPRRESGGLGEFISGQDVVAIHGVAPEQTVEALAPGRAYVRLAMPSAYAECVRIDVPPAGRPPTLTARKRFAFRSFDVAHLKEERVVSVAPGVRWVLPASGTLRFDPVNRSVWPTVDAQCQPSLVASGSPPEGTGVVFEEPDGSQHAYFVDATGDDPTLECHLESGALEIPVGNSSRYSFLSVRRGGDLETLEPLPGGAFRAQKPGSAYFSQKPADGSCHRVVVVPRPSTIEDRIAWVRKRLPEAPIGETPTLLKLHVGDEHRMSDTSPFSRPIDSNTIQTAGGPGNTLTFRAVASGFTGVVVKDSQWASHLIYIEVD
jgi:hypothetical protein